jgi:hypothetical protein
MKGNGILAELTGGDRRSIGRAGEAAGRVLKNPALFPDLFAGLLDSDPLIRMRAADAVEKVTRRRPDLLQPWKQSLLERVSQLAEKEMRWHVAQMLPRLNLTPRERSIALGILTGYLADASSIVKTFSMQALADFALRDEELMAQTAPLIERLTRTGTPAMKSRGRKLLQQFRRANAQG